MGEELWALKDVSFQVQQGEVLCITGRNGACKSTLPQFLFYMSGTVIWTYFADCLTKTSNTFVGNANLFGKVYFPRFAFLGGGSVHPLDLLQQLWLYAGCGLPRQPHL